ncbi:MAG TPA: hypothetical protein EYO21_06415 [Candidatus Marinimicrobia bacterium]|nr:hypothetical protein [Candidatus Neomarinimicrobiota bacterium]
MELADLLNQLDLHTFIAFDFETTGLDPSNDKITEFAAVRFEQGKVVGSYQTLVNPQRPIPSEIVRKTGITDEMVKDAPIEEKVIEKMFEFIGDHPLVAHNFPFDLAFLTDLKMNYLSQEVKNEGYDTVPLSQAFLFFLPNHQLGTIAEYLGSRSEGTHRALADTELLGQLFLKLIHEAASYPLPVIQKILSASEGKSFINKTLYMNLANVLVKSGNLKKGLVSSDIMKDMPSPIFRHEGKRESFPAISEEFFASDGLLAGSFSGGEYEVRQSQINYANFVKDIFDDGAVGVLEAGTGLGKSLAYLMSSLRTALATGGEPVIISCHTKPLQDQLFQREIPKLASALDVSFSATVMKGRQNYVCLTRVDRVIADARTLLSEQEVQSLIVILIWLQWTKSGDFEECTGFLKRRPYRLRSMIQSDPGFCRPRVCKQKGGCFLGPLRDATQDADLIVVNHSFLLYELENQNILPSLKTVVIDEAHNLIRVGYNHFRVRVSNRIIADQLSVLSKSSSRGRRIKLQMNAISQSVPEASKYFTSLCNAAEHLIETSSRFFDALSKNGVGNYSSEVRYEHSVRIRNLSEHFMGLEEELSTLQEAFAVGASASARLQSVITEAPDNLKDAEVSGIINRVTESIISLADALSVVSDEEEEDWVYWETGKFVRGDLKISLNAVPIDTGPNLRSLIFDNTAASVLTSATLSLNTEFSYFLGRFGLEGYEEKQVKVQSFSSPFYYEDQCTYLQWAGKTGPKDQNFVPLLAKLVESLFHQYGKRTLVLFTSRAMLRECLERLESSGFGNRVPLLAQLSTGSRPALINQFRRTSNGILLGTSSFWEGIDLPGDLLEILVIAKIPFDVPNEPTTEAYNEKIEESGGNSFLEHSVPAAAIRLRQGFGRLIRSMNDEGIFINMDNRVVKKRYGHVFQSVIPVTMKTFSEESGLHVHA